MIVVTESRSGFSDCELTANTILMPFLAFLLLTPRWRILNSLDLSDQQVSKLTAYTCPRFNISQPSLRNMSERIDISTVQVTAIERSSNDPFLEEWTGHLKLNDEEIRFTTDEKLKEGEQYKVVWERSEILGSEHFLTIHKVINNGS